MSKRIMMALLCVYMAGCSLQQTPQDAMEPRISWEEQQALLAQITQWDISGKIGIRTEQDSQSASLKWLQKQDDYQIDIRGPWGQGGASISGQPGKVVVDIAGEGVFTGPDPESILKEQLDWELPITDIYWWIRGLPAPDKAFQHELLDKRLKTLSQSGWEINYLSYNTLSPTLPRKVRMTRNGLQVTVVISSWILNL